MFNFIVLAASSGSGSGIFGSMGMFIPLVLIFVLMYFMMIRPQSKQRKEEEAMRNSTEIGDDVTTIGGIVGKVVSVKDDDTIIIETGADRVKMKLKRWAIQSNNTKQAAYQKQREEAKKAKEEAKRAKKEAKSKK